MLLGPCHCCDLPLRFSAVPFCHCAPVFLSLHVLHLYFPAPASMPLVVSFGAVLSRTSMALGQQLPTRLASISLGTTKISNPLQSVTYGPGACFFCFVESLTAPLLLHVPYPRALPCLVTFPAMEKMPPHQVRLRISVA